MQTSQTEPSHGSEELNSPFHTNDQSATTIASGGLHEPEGPTSGDEPYEDKPTGIELQLLETPRVVALFTAPWCGVDRPIRSLFETMAGDTFGVVVDMNLHPHLADRFRVEVLPTLLLLCSGEEIGRRTGAFGSTDIAEAVTEVTRR